jgi:hypothetical protein
MSDQALPNFELIYPRGGMWSKLRLPSFPPPSSILLDAEPQIERELSHAFDVISLIEKEDGSRRSMDGVNRAAQIRWPGRRIYIDLVYAILTAWQMAGADAVVELVKGGKEEWDGKLVFKIGLQNDVSEVAAVLHEPERGSKVFVAVPTLVKLLGDNPNFAAPIYLVSAVAKFGRYQFHLASNRIPVPEDVATYCLWYTRIAPDPEQTT